MHHSGQQGAEQLGGGSPVDDEDAGLAAMADHHDHNRKCLALRVFLTVGSHGTKHLKSVAWEDSRYPLLHHGRLTHPPGHLWRDKWAALSGLLSQQGADQLGGGSPVDDEDGGLAAMDDDHDQEGGVAGAAPASHFLYCSDHLLQSHFS